MPPLLKASSYLGVMLCMEAFMATAQFVMPFLQKDNYKSSSNYQKLKKKILKLLSKNGEKKKLLMMSTNMKFFLFT